MNKALALVVLSAVSLPVSGHAHEVDVHVYGTFLPCLDDVCSRASAPSRPAPTRAGSASGCSTRSTPRGP